MLPVLSFAYDSSWKVPTVGECFRLWTKYQMLPNIKSHCTMVARVALTLSRRFAKAGYPLDENLVIASGLLHDLAKTYTIYYGGDHAKLGAGWVLQETQNPAIAQAVISHVLWEFDSGELAIDKNPCTLPILISYADKRVKHDRIVTLKDRFEDLLKRYGTDDKKIRLITENYEQSIKMENALIAFGVDIELIPRHIARLKKERI